MTFDEFDNAQWRCGMVGEYKGEKYPIAACDFEERLIALKGLTLGSDEPTWVRCENVALVN